MEKARLSDEGTTVAGEEVSPMYEIEIRNSDNKTEAQYSFEDQNIYTTDILIEENLLTLNRVVKEGKTYNSTSQEYITNNQEREESSVTLEKYSTDVKETQLRLTFADGIGNTEPELIKPGQIASKEPLTVTLSGGDSGEKFYVYGMGELVAIMTKPAMRSREPMNCLVWLFLPIRNMYGREETEILCIPRMRLHSVRRAARHRWRRASVIWSGMKLIR